MGVPDTAHNTGKGAWTPHVSRSDWSPRDRDKWQGPNAAARNPLKGGFCFVHSRGLRFTIALHSRGIQRELHVYTRNMETKLSPAALRICAQYFPRSCGGCPILRECNAPCAGGKDALIKHTERVNSAAAKVTPS